MILSCADNEYITQNYECNIEERIYEKTIFIPENDVNNWKTITEDEYNKYIEEYYIWLKYNNYKEWCKLTNNDFDYNDYKKYTSENYIKLKSNNKTNRKK